MTFERIELSASNLVLTEDGPLLRTDDKSIPKWAWPGSRDPISKFWNALITFEWIQLSASNLVRTWRSDPCCVRTTNRPLCGFVLGHVTQFRNFGTPYNCWRNLAIRFEFSTYIEHGLSSVRTTKRPKVGVAWVTWPNFEILGPLYNFWTKLAIRFKFGTEIEDGSLLRTDHKSTLSGRGLGHMTQYQNFGTPL